MKGMRRGLLCEAKDKEDILFSGGGTWQNLAIKKIANELTELVPEGSFSDKPFFKSLVTTILDYISKECPDATNAGDKSHEKVSCLLVWFVILFAAGSFVGTSYFAYYAIEKFYDSVQPQSILPKTPFIFIGLTLMLSLMFIDSTIKTLKYKTRLHENIISSIVKNIGIFMLIWYVLNKN